MSAGYRATPDFRDPTATYYDAHVLPPPAPTGRAPMTAEGGGGQESRTPRLLGRLLGSRGPVEDVMDAEGGVIYARSLDGRHLWLALDGPATGLALQHEVSGASTLLTDLGEVVVGDRTEACVALDRLDGWTPSTDEGNAPGFLLVSPEGSVQVAPGASIGDADSLTQGPDVDGWRAEVSMSGIGVRVARRGVDSRARVRRIEADERSVMVWFHTDLPQPCEVVLRGPDGEIGTVLRTDGSEDDTALMSCILDPDAAGIEPGVHYEVRVESAAGQAVLVRDRDGLRRPGGAIAMPRVAGTRAHRPSVLRLRFVRGGRLTAQLLVTTANERSVPS